MDEHIQRLIEEARRTGKPIISRHIFTESITHLNRATQRTSAEMHNLDGMAIETNDPNLDFGKFFYDHLPAITGQEALLVHSYQLTPEQKRGYTQKFTVDVKYSSLEKTARVGQVFELRGKERKEHFELVVKSLKTIKGTTYSVERIEKQE